MSPLLGRLLIGRRGLTVEFISPPVASDIVFDSRQIKKKKKKIPVYVWTRSEFKGAHNNRLFFTGPM